jgi:hypothetical protein
MEDFLGSAREIMGEWQEGAPSNRCIAKPEFRLAVGEFESDEMARSSTWFQKVNNVCVETAAVCKSYDGKKMTKCAACKVSATKRCCS